MARRRRKSEINVFGNAAFMDAMANTVGALIFLLLMVVVVTIALKLNYFDLVIKSADKLPDAVAGRPYDVVLAGFGGNQPYNWKLVRGLPANGLDLRADKDTVRETRQQRDYSGNVPHVFGIPTSPTVTPIVFEVELTDTAVLDEKTGAVTIDAKVTRKTFELVIQPASYSPPPLAIKTGALPVAVVGREYTLFVSATGGEPPYAWTAEGTPLKQMLKIDSGEGRMTGVPTEVGEWPVRLRVQDRVGRVVESPPIVFRAANLRDATEMERELAKLRKPLHVTTRTLPDAILGRPYELTLAAEGGIPPYKWSACNASNLGGLSLAADGRLSGTPKAGSIAVKACVQAESGDTAESPELKLNAITVPPVPAPLRMFTPGKGERQ